VTARVPVLRRVDPCSCGCEGRDPWHARRLDRVVSDVRPATGTARCAAEPWSLDFDALGTASAPWSDEPVVVARWTAHGRSLGWVFVKDVVEQAVSS
jgi:hypothetical protein